MTFMDIAVGETVFIDANTYIYSYLPDPQFGPPSYDLLTRVEAGQVVGVTTTHMLSEVTHRLMTLEAERVFSWPRSAVVKKLRQQPVLIRQLLLFSRAIAEILQSQVRILPVQTPWIQRGTQISDTYGLLTNDAISAAAMEAHGIPSIASNDTDFDRIPTIRRYAAA